MDAHDVVILIRGKEVVKDMSNNASIQSDELEALIAIYGECITKKSICEHHPINFVRYEDSDFFVEIIVPREYPMECFAQIKRLVVKSGDNRAISSIIDSANEVMFSCIGSEILFQVIENIRSNILLNHDAKYDAYYGPQIIASDIQEDVILASNEEFSSLSHIVIHHGAFVVDRGSTFQAHLSFVNCMVDVETFRSKLLSDKKVKVNHICQCYVLIYYMNIDRICNT